MSFTRLVSSKRKQFIYKIYIEIFNNTSSIANDIYLNNYYTYERVTNEVKPDLFFCHLTDDVCYDMAWKLKKPVIGFVGSSLG